MEKIAQFFKFEERSTNLKTELIAGVSTFLAMAYILPVNAGMLSLIPGVPFLGVFAATAIAAAVGTLVMGLWANYPVALAPGMGVNAFFVYTVVLYGYGLSFEAALSAVFIEGIIFLIISVTGLRKMIIDAIPRGLKFAVGAGIGFFITFIGLKNAGIITANPATFVSLGDLGNPTVLLAIFGIFLVVALYAYGSKFSLIISMAAVAFLGLILGAFGVDFMPAYSSDIFSYGDLFDGIGEVFGAVFSGFGELFDSPDVVIIIFTFLFIDFFDTAGTLMAVGNAAGLIDEEGHLKDGDKALLSDSIGTIAGAIAGTSTVTSYVESTVGIEQGGRTGLTAVVVAVLFLVSIAFSPMLSLINGVEMTDIGAGVYYSPVTSMALVMVGALMVGQLKFIDWDDKAIVIPAFLTIVFMILSFSIAMGIAIGFIFYPIIMVAQKRYKEVNPMMYALAALFLLQFIITYS
ncbi:MAG: NCS2 family permease [Candidatus Izemoplasma sp.]